MELSLRNISFFISPQKLNLCAGLVRGKGLAEALRILSFAPHKGARLLSKLLGGAAKSLSHQNKAAADYFLYRLEVNRGPIFKRSLYRAKGRTDRMHRRHSLVSCVLKERVTL